MHTYNKEKIWNIKHFKLSPCPSGKFSKRVWPASGPSWETLTRRCATLAHPSRGGGSWCSCGAPGTPRAACYAADAPAAARPCHAWSRPAGFPLALKTKKEFNQCCGSVTCWHGSGSSDPYLWLTDPDSDLAPDPAIFVSDFQNGY